MMTAGHFDTVFGVIDPDDLGDDLAARKTMLRIGTQMVAHGLAVVIDRPGEKIPVCPLTARDRKAADQEAIDAAVLAERPRAHMQRHACGLHHAITDPDVALKTLSRLANKDPAKGGIGRFNLGVEPRASRLVIVDADDPDQLAAFRHAAGPMTELTVISPGQIGDGDPDDQSTWAHHGGGHIWYRVPDGVEMPRSTGLLRDESGWVAMWGEHQVLVPPSRRPEGVYRWAGGVREAPAWLLKRIHEAGEAQQERIEASRVRREASGPSEIDDWSTITRWDDLLSDDGWAATGMQDTCSCPVWTAPGPHGSAKSATAHEPGCSSFECERGHGPLHVWTDNPSPAIAAAVAEYGSTLTKAQAGAHIYHDGSMGKMFRAADALVSTGRNAISNPMPSLEAVFAETEGEDTGQGSEDAQRGAQSPEDASGGEGTGPDWSPSGVPAADDPGRMPNLDDEFWSARPELAHIRQAAYSRGVGADAALLAVLTRLASVVHHRCTVDLGAGPASLNLIGMVVGPSGVGKSRAMDLADELIELPADLRMGNWQNAPIGTGEGLIELYWGTESVQKTDEDGNAKPGRPTKVRKLVRHNAYVFHDEAEGLFVAAGRKDATLMSVLRSMWSGRAVGQSNASHENTRKLDKLDYSWGAMLGIQPEKAGPLFDDAAGGTPQRFLFAAVTDPRFPVDDLPDHPGVLRQAGTMLRRGEDPAPVHYTVPESIAAGIRHEQALRVRGEGEAVDELDAHSVLMLMKLSALFAVLHRNERLTVEDWHLAERVWECSKQVRAATADAVRAERAEEARARDEREAKLHVTKTVWAEQVKVTRGVKLVERVATKLGRKVWNDGECTRRALRDHLNSRDVAEYGGGRAALLSDAIAAAVSTGYLANVERRPGSYERGSVQPEQ